MKSVPCFSPKVNKGAFLEGHATLVCNGVIPEELGFSHSDYHRSMETYTLKKTAKEGILFPSNYQIRVLPMSKEASDPRQHCYQTHETLGCISFLILHSAC